MDELENLNKPVKNSYFDQNTYEEDIPIYIDKEKQDYYSKLELVFNNICDDITVENASVSKFSIKLGGKLCRKE